MAKGGKRRAATAKEKQKAPIPAPPPFNPDQMLIDNAKAFVSQSKDGITVQAGRLVKKYSPLERDLALLEVMTDQGPYEVVAGRDGSMTIFHKD